MSKNDRWAGIHVGCGGEVRFRTTASQGWRVCLRCGNDSRARFALQLTSELPRTVPGCPTCDEPGTFKPSHLGSERCQSGSIASGGRNSHCTCDTCF